MYHSLRLFFRLICSGVKIDDQLIVCLHNAFLNFNDLISIVTSIFQGLLIMNFRKINAPFFFIGIPDEVGAIKIIQIG